jgi:hypothetical protein
MIKPQQQLFSKAIMSIANHNFFQTYALPEATSMKSAANRRKNGKLEINEP